MRPLYLLEKTVATFGTFTLLYTITAHVILPLTPTPEQSFFRSLLDLSLPFMVRAFDVPKKNEVDVLNAAFIPIIILLDFRYVPILLLRQLLIMGQNVYAMASPSCHGEFLDFH